MPMTRNRIALLALVLTACQAEYAEEGTVSSALTDDEYNSVVAKIQKMQDMEEIRQLKARYFRCMDQKDWDCFAQTLHEDVDFNVAGALYACKEPLPIRVYDDVPCTAAWPSGEVTFDAETIGYLHANFGKVGRAAVVQFERDFLEYGQTMHQGHMPEITITSPTTAKAIWTLTHHLLFQEGLEAPGLFPDNGRAQHELFGYGFYTEEYEKVSGVGWQIKKLRFTSFRVEIH
jgi:hypothetical protein